MHKTIALLLLVAAAVVAGCSNRQTETGVNTDFTAVGAKYLTDQEPAEVRPVAEAIRADDESEVTVVGRIGGDSNPWIEDMAAFMIVDPSLQACSDMPDHGCPTPWDYCCDSAQMKTHSVTVKFLDDQGSVVPVDARKLFGVEPLQTVVVQGKLQKDESGRTVVLAEKMHVKK